MLSLANNYGQRTHDHAVAIRINTSTAVQSDGDSTTGMSKVRNWLTTMQYRFEYRHNFQDEQLVEP